MSKPDRFARRLIAFAFIAQALIGLSLIGCITVNTPTPAPSPAPVPSPVEPAATTGTEAKVRAAIVRWENAVAKDYQAVADNAALKSNQDIDDFLAPRMAKNREDLHSGIGDVFSAELGTGDVPDAKRRSHYTAAAKGAKR